MRLIDADELKKLILAERDKIPLTTPGAIYEFGVAQPNPHGQSMRGGIRKALRCMERCPTVDAKPVVHGRWITHNRGQNNWCECSECNTVGSPFWKRCPVCEAKMDGDGNG